MGKHWNRRESAQWEDDSLWKVALGVAAGVLIAGAIGWAIRLYFIHAALQEFQNFTTTISRQSEEQIKNARAASELQQARHLQAIAAQAAASRAAAQAVANANRARVMAAEAKEAAWSRYYRKPPHCDVAEGPAFVECANDYIRAKRRFEAQYSAAAN